MKERILIVDDEEVMQDILSELLSREGYRVDAVATGEKGLELVSEKFYDVVILDTAGRYAIPVDESRDKEEWQKFLTLLVKYRKKEPLNGLVVTISADKLLAADPESLAEDGRNIRRRIDELMRVMGNKFPVYVLVTKCDLVQGMTQFCDSLPEKTLDQAMGVAKQNLKTDVGGFLARVGI